MIAEGNCTRVMTYMYAYAYIYTHTHTHSLTHSLTHTHTHTHTFIEEDAAHLAARPPVLLARRCEALTQA